MRTIDSLAHALERPKRQGDGSYMVRCPAHDDKQASLHISAGKDGKILLHCHAGCDTDKVMAAAGISWADVTPAPERKIVAVYPYKDEAGKLLYETVRYDPKDFRQRVPDGAGGYKWSLKDTRRVLYNLPALAPAIAKGSHILLVEGEKDVDALNKFGIVATTSPMGAGKFLKEYAESLKGALIDLIPDNDDTGREHMNKAAALLHGIAKEIRIIDPCALWPDLPPKGDISDVIQKLGNAGTLDSLAHAIDAAPVYTPHVSDRSLQTISAAALSATEFKTLVEPVQNLVVEGVTLLVGASKIGKSWLVLALCIAVAGGQPFLERQTLQGDVLYLALEDSQRRLQSRLRKLGASPQALAHMDLCTEAFTLDDGITDQIKQWIDLHPAARLVVIDTLQKIRGIPNRNQNAYQADYSMMAQVKRLADSRHVAVVLVHHTNKLRIVNDAFDKVNGSTGLMGAADTTILIDRDRSEAQATMQIAGRDVYGDDMLIRFDDGAWRVVSTNATAYNAEQVYAANPVVQLLRKVVADNPEGGRFTYERLINDGIRLLGQSPFVDARDFTKKLKDIRGELSKRDGIEIETGVPITVYDDGTKHNTRGVKVTAHPPVTCFQTRLNA